MEAPHCAPRPPRCACLPWLPGPATSCWLVLTHALQLTLHLAALWCRAASRGACSSPPRTCSSASSKRRPSGLRTWQTGRRTPTGSTREAPPACLLALVVVSLHLTHRAPVDGRSLSDTRHPTARPPPSQSPSPLPPTATSRRSSRCRRPRAACWAGRTYSPPRRRPSRRRLPPRAGACPRRPRLCSQRSRPQSPEMRRAAPPYRFA